MHSVLGVVLLNVALLALPVIVGLWAFVRRRNIAFLLIVYLIPNGVVGRIESALRSTGRKGSHA